MGRHTPHQQASFLLASAPPPQFYIILEHPESYNSVHIGFGPALVLLINSTQSTLDHQRTCEDMLCVLLKNDVVEASVCFMKPLMAPYCSIQETILHLFTVSPLHKRQHCFINCSSLRISVAIGDDGDAILCLRIQDWPRYSWS